MRDAIIQVENLSKRYVLGRQQGGARYRTLREHITDTLSAPFRRNRAKTNDPADFWALRDVNFEVQPGEVVGIIGRNGAGKSTLLKVLSRITEPTNGRIRINGRVASLLEVGTGFHPELTGRENIFLNGAILGMHRTEIKAKFDEIVDFAEVEKFLDTPVKRYSSGMYVRLAFAVAAHLEPEILVVDEVLAVGDAEFQKKCLGKMENVSKREGRTVLFVSHNMGTVNTLCSRVIYLERGTIKETGPAERVIASYFSALRTKDTQGLDTLRLAGFGKDAWFTSIQLVHDGSSGMHNGLYFGQDITFEMEASCATPLRGISIGSSIFDQSGNCVGSLLTKETFSLEPGQRSTFRLTIKSFGLAPGHYFIGCSLGQGGNDGGMRQEIDIVIGQPAFEILPVSSRENAFVANWASTWGSIAFQKHHLEVLGTLPQTLQTVANS